MPSQMQCRYSSIRRRRISVLGSAGISAPPSISIAIDLIASAPQTGHAIAVQVALPSQELIDRDAVEPAQFFDRYPIAAYGFNHSRLAPRGPPLSRGG